MQLFTQFIGGEQYYKDISNVAAYLGTFDKSLSHLHVPIYYGFAVLTLLPFMVERLLQRKVDFGLILIVLAFLALSTGYHRLSYFCPVAIIFSLNHLLRESKWWLAIYKQPALLCSLTAVCITLMLGLVTHRIQMDSIGDLRGEELGVGYSNPKEEAGFVGRYFPEERFCNGYNGGGYLLWKLWPKQKVMIDPRHFPYSTWYAKWITTRSSKNPQNNMREFDCNIWVLNHTYKHMSYALIKMPEWKLAFVGKSGAEFVRSELYTRLGGFHVSDDLNSVASIKNLNTTISTIHLNKYA